jgi:hypothetical protein
MYFRQHYLDLMYPPRKLALMSHYYPMMPRRHQNRPQLRLLLVLMCHHLMHLYHRQEM